MSTRSQWLFREGNKQIALIYKHSDGYPDGEHGGFAVWTRFIDMVKKDCSESMYGTRFDDAEYLASKFLYFLIRFEDQNNTLAFGGVGIGNSIHVDIEYLYEIDCDTTNAPQFRCKSMNTNKYISNPNKKNSEPKLLLMPLKKFGNRVYLRLERDKHGKFLPLAKICK